MSFKTSLRAIGRGKVVKVVGAILATAVITTGIAHLSSSIAKDQAKIDKYVNDKDGYAVAAVLCEDLNATMAENGVEDIYTNPQFRGMIAHRDTGANPHEEVIEIYLVAQKEDKPYMVKASIDNEDEKVSGKTDALLSTYNPHILKYNIIENIDNLEISYDITPTTLETLKMLDALGESKTPLNAPQGEHQHLGKSVIAGYSVAENEDGTFKVTITSNLQAVHLNEGLLSSTESDYYNKELSFNIDSKENIEEKIANFLKEVIVKGADEYSVKYSRAGVSTDYQGTGKAYEIREVQKPEAQVEVEAEPER